MAMVCRIGDDSASGKHFSRVTAMAVVVAYQGTGQAQPQPAAATTPGDGSTAAIYPLDGVHQVRNGLSVGG